MRPCDLSNILGQLDADDLNRLDRKTREVVRGVEETGQQGSITLKLTLKKNGENSTIYEIKDSYKVPEKAAGKRVLFFAYDDMNHATGVLSPLPHKQEPLFKGENVTPIKGAK
jgi:hypothetical protein